MNKTSLRTALLYEHDLPYFMRGVALAGMDEAGRGPLAGNVVAACVMMPQTPFIEGIDDSKRLSEKKREALYPIIMETALFAAVGEAAPEEIDRINILEATRLAMRRAALHAPAELILVDALEGLDLPCEGLAIVHGDAISYSIAAASIVAKVTRDRQMRALDARYPEYGFLRNKGYGTAEHIAALGRLGATDAHRRSFIGKFLPPGAAQ